MKFDKLNGRELKKDLYDRCGKKPTSASRSWHNEHTDGSGNFGYVIDFGKGKPQYCISGEYDVNKKITEITVSKYFMRNNKDIEPITYGKVLKEICRRIKQKEKVKGK